MKNHTILWADDDQDDLMLIRDVLQDLDHNTHIIEVSNGQEALDYLNANRHEGSPCLIVLDMNMPVLNGKETLALIKKEEDFKSIPVVIFTTSNSRREEMVFKHYGVEMITKPAEYAALKKAVEKLLSLCDSSNHINSNATRRA